MATESLSSALVPFSDRDKIYVRSLERRELLSLVRTYGLSFAFVALVHYTIPLLAERYSEVNLQDIQWGYTLFAIFFIALLFYLALKDYWMGLRLIRQEAQEGRKLVIGFTAQKYYDPIFRNYLLFYPGKENVYIRIYAASFEQLEDGAPLQLEIMPVTGTILMLSSGLREIPEAEEYRFR